MKCIKRLNMIIYIVKDYDEMSKKAAQIVAGIIKETQNPILGLATGDTVVGMYQELIRMNKAGELDFRRTRTFNLDEYYPICKENKQSYSYYMKDTLFKHINIDIENTHVPNGAAKNIAIECKNYEKKVREAGKFDLQVLGIGSNGHIGFNEPSDTFEMVTHKADLTEKTIQDNSRFFESIEEMPREAITLGIGSIMNAKKIMLMANGAHKAKAIKETLLGKVAPQAPASILQFHPDLTVILDEVAGAELLKHL